jgi:hypothetical protein
VISGALHGTAALSETCQNATILVNLSGTTSGTGP